MTVNRARAACSLREPVDSEQSTVNRARAHPYRVFPHYNSWFHLGIWTYENEDARALDALGLDAGSVTLEPWETLLLELE